MKIGIVNEHANESERLQQAIALHADYHVVWSTDTMDEAVALCRAAQPDLVLLDVEGESVDGVVLTRHIRANAACKILIVTRDVHKTAAKVFEAMGEGALDAVDAPRLEGPIRDEAAPLLAKLATLSRLVDRTSRAPSRPRSLVAIGASAGGPATLASIVGSLPGDFAAAIVIVQHVEPTFAAGMAAWLAHQTPLDVRVARDGDSPAEGAILIAGSKEHLIFKDADHLGYTPDPPDQIHCPSIDVFFHSVARTWRERALGVLLTGMGGDGAEGLKALRARGFHTIAQDEATSMVYGMPRAAARLNAAVEILSAERIASRLVELVSPHPVVSRTAG